MTKSTTSFVCQECGYDTPQWLGKCPECGNWNSLREISNISARGGSAAGRKSQGSEDLKPKTLSEVTYHEKERINTGFSEMDGVFGGGIVPGSMTLLAGDPGIGKSTLLLQLALNIAKSTVYRLQSTDKNGSAVDRRQKTVDSKVLYICAEESEEQVKLRANRLDGLGKNQNLLLLSVTNTDAVVEVIQKIQPAFVIVDSIQTMESENLTGLSGSVGQVRYACLQFVKVAKAGRIPIIIVGHVTKEGMVAGPMVLSHIVDTVLFLEGEKTTGTRILRSLKNRFGPVDEVGIFLLEATGMREVKHPEQVFLTDKTGSVPGSVLTVILEGTRTFLVEIQALVVFSKLPIPRRVSLGIESRRLELLLAVLQKHCRVSLESLDVFVNVAGGLKVADPAADAAICLAVFSSLKNVRLSKTVAIAEVGLLGELRKVSLLEKRIKEAKKLGFKHIISVNTHNFLSNAIYNEK